MTVALAVKVHDGVVLAADSASTITAVDGLGNHQLVNVYNNANKVFNLYKGLPIGGLTWGSGSVGSASISTLAKDLRARFTDPDPIHVGWHLDAKSYTIEDVAKRTKKFFTERLGEYPGQKPATGFLVSGYSSGTPLAENWLISIHDGIVDDPVRQDIPEKSQCSWFAQAEAVQRLILGFGTALPVALKDIGIPDDKIAESIKKVRERTQIGLLTDAMPIQDAIDLAEFLVHTAIMLSRFSPGPATVGGPIEIAVITKHEGFKWIKRKHYFDQKCNPDSSI